MGRPALITRGTAGLPSAALDDLTSGAEPDLVLDLSAGSAERSWTPSRRSYLLLRPAGW
ncbi:hypothetical protein ACWC2H_11080 [Streptomyces sp. 900105755]